MPAGLLADDTAAEDLEAFCSGRNIPFVRLTDADYLPKIDGFCSVERLDLMCLTFDRILPQDIVRRLRIINVHPALLPAFRGPGALARALDKDVRFAGATIHEVIPAVDRGPIIAQCVVPTLPDDSATLLGARVFELLRPMFLQVLAWYAQDRVYRETGHIRIRGATYGSSPISPALEIWPQGPSRAVAAPRNRGASGKE